MSGASAALEAANWVPDARLRPHETPSEPVRSSLHACVRYIKLQLGIEPCKATVEPYTHAYILLSVWLVWTFLLYNNILLQCKVLHSSVCHGDVS